MLDKIRVQAWAADDAAFTVGLVDQGLVDVGAGQSRLEAISAEGTDVGLGSIPRVVLVADSRDLVQVTLLAELGLCLQHRLQRGWHSAGR